MQIKYVGSTVVVMVQFLESHFFVRLFPSTCIFYDQEMRVYCVSRCLLSTFFEHSANYLFAECIFKTYGKK